MNPPKKMENNQNQPEKEENIVIIDRIKQAINKKDYGLMITIGVMLTIVGSILLGACIATILLNSKLRFIVNNMHAVLIGVNILAATASTLIGIKSIFKYLTLLVKSLNTNRKHRGKTNNNE